MSYILALLAKHLGRKALLVGVVVLGTLLLWMAWMYVRDQYRLEDERLNRVARLTAERAEIDAVLADVESRLGEVRAEVERAQRNIESARNVQRSIQELLSWWQRLWMSDADIRRAEERRAWAQQQERLAQGVLGALSPQKGELAGRLEALRARRGALDAELEMAGEGSAFVQAVRRAWEEVRVPLAFVVFGMLFGPTLWAVFLYYGFAPLYARCLPLRIREGPEPAPEAGESRVSLPLALRPGERIHIRENFLQASDDHLRRGTRWILDWRIPFTCLAARLAGLTELRAPADLGGSLTLSSNDDAHTEFVAVDVPVGGALVLRPTALAAIALPTGSRLRIHRHWFLFRRHAWLTGRFRHFEFRGPCRLVVYGARGVRVERLLGGVPGGTTPARRVNADGTLGFSPTLDYTCVPAETFWAFYFGNNPLFDDLFRGQGVFLSQEMPSGGGAARARRFWSSVWQGFLKAFGL
jgi:hypothetical protein